jgi:hypothetical protein
LTVELGKQSRLANPGLANEADGLAVSILDLPKEVVKGSEFALAIDKNRGAKGLRLVQLRAAAMRHTEQAIRPDRFGFAFKYQRPDWLDAGMASRQHTRRLADQDRARLGRLLEAGGEICRITDCRVVHQQIVCNGAEYDGPSVNADPQQQLHSSVIGVNRSHRARLGLSLPADKFLSVARSFRYAPPFPVLRQKVQSPKDFRS